MNEPRISIYSTGRCPICDKTKTLLKKWGIPYREVRVDTDRAGLAFYYFVQDGLVFGRNVFDVKAGPVRAGAINVFTPQAFSRDQD